MKKIIISIGIFLITVLTVNAQPGTIDLSFNPGTGANDGVNTSAIQSDGKIIIGGRFNNYNGTAINRIARLNNDASLDGTFNTGTGANVDVCSSAIQSDGKIIIGGNFTSYNGTAINRIARLNADGSLDGTFNPGAGTNQNVWTIAIQSDGKIIIGGVFTTYNGTAINRIARLNSDGSLDGTFNIGTGVEATVYTTAIQSDGKIIIGGGFTNYNGTAINKIARLNPDGSLDGTFTVGTGANSTIYTSPIQSDGKIIIGGSFTTYNGVARNLIARLNSDGSLDGTFSVGAGADNWVRASAIQSNGKIIIGGDFNTYNGTAINRIARLNSDGSLDGSFTVGTGASGLVRTIPIQTDGKIIVGGEFITYNGTTSNYITRIIGDGGVLIDEGIVYKDYFSLYPNPTNGLFKVELTNKSEITITNTLGEIVLNQTLEAGKQNLSLQNQANGVYFVKVVSEGKQQISKLIKQ